MEIHIQLKLKGSGFPTREELSLRHQIEDLIDEKRIGEIVDAGSGGGVMDIFVEVDDADRAKKAIQEILREVGAEGIATLRVIPEAKDPN